MLPASRIASRRIWISSVRAGGNARRALSTAPPAAKSRSWKSSGVRWGAAAAGVWWYNTSSVFAEEEDAAIQRVDDSLHAIQESRLETVDAIVEEKRARAQAAAAEAELKSQKVDAGNEEEPKEGSEGGLEDLEDEAGQQGAFNPETGEINWDCPCLGGMAHGPCGEDFRAAFSCFVYSKEEPKGMECIDKFKGMQDCFRQHPEMYGAELEDDEEGEFEEGAVEGITAKTTEGTESSEVEAQQEPKEVSVVAEVQKVAEKAVEKVEKVEEKVQKTVADVAVEKDPASKDAAEKVSETDA